MTSQTEPVLAGLPRTGRLAGRHAARPAASYDTTVSTPEHLAELLAAAAAGDHDAFTEFYRVTNAKVLGSARRMLRSAALAEEVAQEVYLHAWSAADRYDATLSTPLSWLLMMTHRRAVDRIRAEQSATDRDVTYGHHQLIREHDTVAETVAQRHEEHAVKVSLQRLSAIQREALTLAYYRGHTYREVAEYLGVPLPTVKSRIRNALTHLQSHLAETISVRE